jgi:ABC-type sugar transport system permease subunit
MLHMQRNKRINRMGYLFISPFFVVFLVFTLYPFAYTFFLSFSKWDGMGAVSPIGWKNFARVISDKVFLQAFLNTLRIWACNFFFQMLVALLLSALFTFNNIKGMKLYRAIYYLPNLITATSVGLLFNLLFSGNRCLANQVLLALGMIKEPIAFFNSEAFTSALVSFVQWWLWFGYTTIIIMAGITSIDSSVYDAARVDGCSKMRTFVSITMPLIRPTLVYMSITSIIGGMQLFDVPSTLSNMSGDPRKSVLTLAMYIYGQGFKNHNYGYASCVSVCLFILIAILCFVAFKVMNKGADHES